MGLLEYSSVDQVQVAIGEVGVAVGHMEALILTYLDMALKYLIKMDISACIVNTTSVLISHF